MIGEKAADLIKAAKHGSKRIKRAGRERFTHYAACPWWRCNCNLIG